MDLASTDAGVYVGSVDPLYLAGAGLVLLAFVAWWFTRTRDDQTAERRLEQDSERPSPGKSERVRKKASSLAIKPLDDADADAFDDDDDEDELTVLRVEVDHHRRRSEPPAADAEFIVADDGADVDIPTRKEVSMLTSAIAQSDRGRKRKRNEDRFLKLDSHYVFAVADGMGGYAGGDVAAELAVETLEEAFREHRFDADVRGQELPWRAAELVKAVQRANLAVYNRGRKDPWLRDMGTTLVAARFAPRKDRVYIAHVGDSRCYRLRDGKLRQLTTDHTFGELGLIDEGSAAGALSRAVGTSPHLTIDVLVAEPKIGDKYLLCSDGLSRMVDEGQIVGTLGDHDDIQDGAEALIHLANEGGGIDNVTVVVIEVCTPSDVIELDERRRAAG